MFEKIYKFYIRNLFSKFSHIRGTTRLRNILRKPVMNDLESFEGEPQSIFERGDWDNLIILDACRYDKLDEIRQDVDYRISLGSTSSEYVERTFTEEKYDDIVYVSANGFLTDRMMEKHLGRTGIFHEKFDTIETDWDDEKGTVLPESVVRDSLTAENLFLDKKKIIHFIQPHYPYLTRDFGERSDTHLPDETDDALKMAERGEISQQEIIEAYEENLEIVLEHAEELAEKVSGKTVITADHGELLGENGLYGHPEKSRAKKLRKVPWYEL